MQIKKHILLDLIANYNRKNKLWKKQFMKDISRRSKLVVVIYKAFSDAKIVVLILSILYRLNNSQKNKSDTNV